MKKVTNTVSTINKLGLVVPIDVEALCIGTDPGAIFEQNPFNFSELGSSTYLSSAIEAGGLTNMSQGVHLHWALPDALAQGRETSGEVLFPAVPDRWLVTRIFCDADKPTKPSFDRWIIESNYFGEDSPNLDRASVTVPYQGEDWEKQPWRHLGKVSTFDDWIAQNPTMKAGSPEEFVQGLSAVGYGLPEFAASYHSSQNILGFNDLGDDLEKLGTSGSDKNLSYHIIGWYSNSFEDPIYQLPTLIPAKDFNDLLNNITNSDDKDFVNQSFSISTYALVNDVPQEDGEKLWKILNEAGYPLEVDIPLNIAPEEFNKVLQNTTNPADKTLLQTYYLADMSPNSDLSDSDKVRLWDIMAAAGFDFLSGLTSIAKWSLPSGTPTPAVSPSFTLYSGLIKNVVWNGNTDYFKNSPGDNFNIAVGNTPGQALSTLVANTSGFEGDQIAEVEEILDALQAGILDEVKDESMLQDWEELKVYLHQSSLSNIRGGFLWEVKNTKTTPGDTGEVTLPDGLAKELNDLNVAQQQLNEYQTEIETTRAQIFSDWYRFMLVYHANQDPSGGIQTPDLYAYILQKITNLKDLISVANDLVGTLQTQEAALRADLGAAFFLSQITAPRYWQPNDPVLLFEGDGIDPSDRFGNDGRFMADGTLVCRLSTQQLSSVVIPSGALGNASDVTINASDVAPISNPQNPDLTSALNGAVTDAAVLNQDIIASYLQLAGVSTDFKDLSSSVEKLIESFLTPAIPSKFTKDAFEILEGKIYTSDKTFLNTQYKLSGEDYVLQTPVQDLSDQDALRLIYILNSTSFNTSAGKLNYSGIPLSEVGIHTWTENPWLPFSLKWSVYYYPLCQVKPGGDDYPTDFITSNFKIGDTNLDYIGPEVTPSTQGIELYKNTIFLTPHANINLKKQLSQFIEHHDDDPILDELNSILAKLDDKPILSQALSGMNESLTMLQKVLQLAVADPQATDVYYNFSNKTVPEAVDVENTSMPLTTIDYNPIRVGLMKIADITLIDVYGRNVKITQPSMVYRAENMKQTTMKPELDVYLPPRITQPARLLFRWLSALDDTIEMNTHPAATPICGWVLANHLDSSLWVYDNKGNPYGSLILNSKGDKILWQCNPGSPYFGLKIDKFFEELGDANPHMKDFVLSLYGTGDASSANYLKSFMQTLDTASLTTEPANFKQYQTNAVLMGRPFALVRASIDLELRGIPAYNQSWVDLKHQVDENNMGNFIPGNDYGLTKVDFPVKIGNIPQTEDGLIGYFKDNDYGTFYSPVVTEPTKHVLAPDSNNLLVNCDPSTDPLVLSMLIEPRGTIHASTGILPVKNISIPPDQYVDALQRLQLAFLTSPVLTPKEQLSMPVPAQTGGFWEWVENDGTSWSEQQKINPVTLDAVMNYTPQEILEGWLNLSSILLAGNNFNLINTKDGRATLYISDDPNDNIFTFTLTNKTGLPLSLTGGTPVSGSYQNGGSSFVVNFGSMLDNSIVSQMRISADGWESKYFSQSNGDIGFWSTAPKADLTLAENDSIVFSITGITCPTGTPSGNFQIEYFGLPKVPDSLAPVLLPLNTQDLPTQKKKN